MLVLHDLIGLSLDKVPRFVRPYADIKGAVTAAVAAWRQDVEARRFPAAAETPA